MDWAKPERAKNARMIDMLIFIILGLFTLVEILDAYLFYKDSKK